MVTRTNVSEITVSMYVCVCEHESVIESKLAQVTWSQSYEESKLQTSLKGCRD